MRWDELTVEQDRAGRLPGFRDPPVIRTFDAPEALDTRFYEVRARSALNKVPARSRMPFPWTINPYRGCSHACVYCTWGETPILMADGRTRSIADLEVGDRIVGTVQEPKYHRYVETEVLAHWSTVKPAHRVTLADGTDLIASGDHRFLSGRGWKHVTGAEQGRLRRPHLTLNDKLMGTGGFAPGPEAGDDYKRGYLCGMIRGDGHVGSYSYTRPGRTRDDHHRFRLALTDLEGLQRTRSYLTDIGVATRDFAFREADAAGKAVRAIRTSTRASVELIRELIEWPRHADAEWCKGFLAGIFDAEGSCSRGVLRICNTDPSILDWTAWCLRLLGFDSVREDRGLANGLVSIRLRGGLRERLRFFHTVDTAISRKRTVQGTAIKSNAELGVVGIEPLGMELPMYDITTGTGDFIANGVVSHNCFARPTHKYLDFNAGRDFDKEIVVKVNVPELLRAELARPSWKFEHVALGTNTDPYQWVEGRYKLMPGIWEAFRDFANPCSVLTKSPLVLRDLPLLKQVAERAPVTANFSVPTLEEKAWRASEPHTPHPRARLEAIAELTSAGIPTGILIAPLMPGINDSPEQVEKIVEIATEAGAVSIGGIALHLRGEVREITFDWLRSYRPDLIPMYEQLYRRGAYAPKAVQNEISERVSAAKRKSRFVARRPARGIEPRARQERRKEPEQTSLF